MKSYTIEFEPLTEEILSQITQSWIDFQKGKSTQPISLKTKHHESL